MRAVLFAKLDAPAREEGIGAEEQRAEPLAHRSRKGRVDFAGRAGVEDLDSKAEGVGRRLDISQRGLGRRSRRADERGDACGRGQQLSHQLQALRHQLGTEILMPVRLPPGRARLATRPSLTGSSVAMKTIGIEVVANLAASDAPATVLITATCLRTKSAANSGSRSTWFSVQRYSIARFSPSMYPASFRPRRNARSRSPIVSGADIPRIPITGTPGCCARAASGQPAAAPPSSVMSSRRPSSGRDVRFIARPPPRTVRAAFPHTACMGASLSRVHHAIFVVLCCFILLFDPRREHSSVPTAYNRRRRAQRRSRTTLLQRRRRLVLDQREHGGRLPVIGWFATR